MGGKRARSIDAIERATLDRKAVLEPTLSCRFVKTGIKFMNVVDDDRHDARCEDEVCPARGRRWRLAERAAKACWEAAKTQGEPSRAHAAGFGRRRRILERRHA